MTKGKRCLDAMSNQELYHLERTEQHYLREGAAELFLLALNQLTAVQTGYADCRSAWWLLARKL